MTLALLATFAFAPAPFSASDYFPTRPGRRMTYEEKSLQSGSTVDVVEEPAEVNLVKVVPVATYQNGAKINTTYYRVDEDGISIVAYNLKSHLEKPMPVLKVPAADKVTWEYEGPASADKYAEPIQMKGEAQFLKGDRDVFGKKVPALQVRMVAKVGGGKAQEEIEQVSVYGKGIGLIESTATTKIGKRKVVTTQKLLKVEEPKEGS